MLITPDQTRPPHGRATLASDRYSELREISLREIYRVVAEKRRFVFRNSLVAAIIGAVVAFLIPPTYTAEAVILTPQQSQSTLSSLAQLGGSEATSGLAALGWLSDFGIHNPTALHIGILESRTIADAIISRLDLERVYRKKDLYSTRKQLSNSTSIKAGKDTLIHIRVEDRDPKMAARIAQAYVDELARMNTTVALTEASQRRLFFEQQVAKEKEVLATADTAVRDAQQNTGLVVPAGQAEALVRSLAVLQEQILSKEAQVEAMKTYIADENPRLRVAERELGALKADLRKLEQAPHTPGTPEIAASQLPQAGLQVVQPYRDVKYHEALFALLSKEYEAARMDEAKAGSTIQLIDRPIPPERKSWPPRKMIVLSCCMLAGLGTAGWFVMQHPAIGA